MKKVFLTIVFILILGLTLMSQEKDPVLHEKDLQQYSGKIVQLIQDGKITEAFSYIRVSWPIPEAEIANLETRTIKQLNMVKERFGKPMGVILVSEREVAETFHKFVYVIKYERHITRWVFIFYKPDDRWLLNSFKWDDDIDEVF